MNHYSFHEMFPACGRRLVACLTNNMNLSGSYDGGEGFIPSRTTLRAGVNPTPTLSGYLRDTTREDFLRFIPRWVGAMILGFAVLAGAAQAAEPAAAAATPVPLTEDADTVLFHELGPDDALKIAGQPLEFAPGLTKESQALLLKPTEEKQTGVSFTLKPYLGEGTVEIWFYFDEVPPARHNQILVNLGTAGNTKWRIELRSTELRGLVVSKEKQFGLRGPPVEPGRWHHAALTWFQEESGKTAKLYLDGQQVAESEGPLRVWGEGNDLLTVGDGPDWSQELGYGWHWNENNFVGRLAYLRVSLVGRKEFEVFKK